MSITLFLKSPFPPLFPPFLFLETLVFVFIRICVLIDMGFGKCIPVCAYSISDFEGQRSKSEVGEGEGEGEGEGGDERKTICLFIFGS